MITPLIQKTVVTITFLGFLLGVGVVAIHYNHIPPYISLVVFAATLQLSPVALIYIINLYGLRKVLSSAQHGLKEFLSYVAGVAGYSCMLSANRCG